MSSYIGNFEIILYLIIYFIHAFFNFHIFLKPFRTFSIDQHHTFAVLHRMVVNIVDIANYNFHTFLVSVELRVLHAVDAPILRRLSDNYTPTAVENDNPTRNIQDNLHLRPHVSNLRKYLKFFFIRNTLVLYLQKQWPPQLLIRVNRSSYLFNKLCVFV